MTVIFNQSSIVIDNVMIRDLPVQQILQRLVETLNPERKHRYVKLPDLTRDSNLLFAQVDSADIINQDKVWQLLASFLRPGDIVLGETGTAGYGVREMLLPKHVRLLTPITWLSIGYMLPASQGTSLAQRELIEAGKYNGLSQGRTVLFIGDGSIQMTAQEISTIIRHKLDVTIFLINNDGYTIERCIHGMDQGYNDVSPWRYLHLPNAFGASPDCFTASVRTYGDLENVLNDSRLADGKGLRMVEVLMDRNDAPAGTLLNMLNEQKSCLMSGSHSR